MSFFYADKAKKLRHARPYIPVVVPRNLTPVNAVKGTAVAYTAGATAPNDGDHVTIAGKRYTFKTTLGTAPAVEGQVLIGSTTNAAAALDNLKSAINHTGTPGTDYTCAAAHPLALATTNTNTAQTVEPRLAGLDGNFALISTSTSGGAWDSAAITGGLDGTVGDIGELCQDATYLYITELGNTIRDANWRRIAKGSAY
jgi:hypothetical protein